jgi:hypothetical protein
MGFVSNSSTSSFCLLGYQLEPGYVKEIFNLEADEDERYDIADELISKLDESNIDMVVETGSEDDDQIYIGLDLTSLFDKKDLQHKTLKEIKDEVKSQLEAISSEPIKKKVDTFSEAYYS